VEQILRSKDKVQVKQLFLLVGLLTKNIKDKHIFRGISSMSSNNVKLTKFGHI